MDHFQHHDGRLYAEDVPVARIAEQHGTPTYIYSRATLERHWRAFDQALADHAHLVCYAVKANSSLAVLDVLARLGAGFDIVSVGELERVLRAGGDPGRVVFSGVAKREDELARALGAGIRCFNVESIAELERLERVAAARGRRAPVSLRVNPNVDARTHPYIATGLRENKFGIDIAQALEVYTRADASPHLVVSGIDCHIGSQLTDVGPFVDALGRVLELADALAARGIDVQHLDLGGGLGIRYAEEAPPEPAQWAAALGEALGERRFEILVEPGRAIAGNAGILLTRVDHIKAGEPREFCIVDAAMNDLLRPALYDAWHTIVPVETRDVAPRHCDVVGPVCETGDFLGRDRRLAVEPGDLLAVRSAGAYGFAMSSNYNSRPRAAEIMVDGDQTHVIRERETIDDLMRGEHTLPR